MPSKITLVTLNFLANGGDGYPMKQVGDNFRYLWITALCRERVDEALDFPPAVSSASSCREGQISSGNSRPFENTCRPSRDTRQSLRVSRYAENLDLRIQNLNSRTDAVLKGTGFDAPNS